MFKEVQVILPEGLSRLGSVAFRNAKALKEIHIPSSVKTIENFALGVLSADGSGGFKAVKDFKIYGKKGSAAEKYATARAW